MGRRVLRRVLRRGSKKGLSRRHLEGRSTPFREYDPVASALFWAICYFSWRTGLVLLFRANPYFLAGRVDSDAPESFLVTDMEFVQELWLGLRLRC